MQRVKFRAETCLSSSNNGTLHCRRVQNAHQMFITRRLTSVLERGERVFYKHAVTVRFELGAVQCRERAHLFQIRADLVGVKFMNIGHVSVIAALVFVFVFHIIFLRQRTDQSRRNHLARSYEAVKDAAKSFAKSLAQGLRPCR